MGRDQGAELAAAEVVALHLLRTIVWSVGYWIVYPSWPLVTNYTKGVFGYASRQDVTRELDALKALRAERAGALARTPLEYRRTPTRDLTC